MIAKFWDIEVPTGDIEVPMEDIRPDIDGKYTSADIINIFRSTDEFASVCKEFIY